jgi:hypothetical protein
MHNSLSGTLHLLYRDQGVAMTQSSTRGATRHV